MNKTSVIIGVIFLLITLTACNLPGQDTAPTDDLVATQVSLLLTQNALSTEVAATETVPIPTDTVTVPATPTVQDATPTATATVTPAPDDPAQQLGSPTWTETFDGNTSVWDFDYTQATFKTQNGSLNLTAKTNANWHSWQVSSPKLQKAYVEMTLQMANCSGLDRVGLAVRASSDGQQFYFMGITCDGQWGFFRMAPDVNINQISAYQQAAPLASGTNNPHRVGIWMDGSTFTFYIDGEKVGTATDATLTDAGYTGFLIAYASNPGFTAKIDTLKYWNIP